MATWSTDSLKNELLQRLRTENPIVNLLLSSLVFFVFTSVLTHAETYRQKLASAWKDCSVMPVRKIYVSGRIYKGGSRYLDVCSDFSLKFKAIMHHLNTTPESWSKIKTLSEVPAAYRSKFEQDKTELLGVSGSVSQLRHDVWCKTHVSKKEHVSDKAAETSENTTISFELYSFRLGLHELHQFVKECVSNYEVYMEKELNKTQQYFIYDGRHKETRELMFLHGDFSSNKTFDNVFFDGSSELRERVLMFEKDEASYKRLGVPYTLGVLLHGCPGTGSLNTSILVFCVGGDMTRHKS